MSTANSDVIGGPMPVSKPGEPAGPGATGRPPGLRAVGRRLRTGELGSWPVAIGLAVIWLVFQSLNENFLTPQNLSNLALQIAATGAISVGVVLVLLLGEIDLSVGSVSGLAAATLAVLTVRNGVSDQVGILIVVLICGLIGVVHGLIITKVGVPSFVVTLAGLIGWQGLQLYVLGPQGTINFPYEGFVAWLTHTNLTKASGWGLGVVTVAAYLAALLLDQRRRRAAGLPLRGIRQVVFRVWLLAVGVAVAVAVLNAWRGVPLALVILVGFVVGFDLVLRRTRYGRSIFAIGGNVEASRRAGLNVDLIRISVFGLASAMAAIGGILAASRVYSAGQQSGGNDVLLLAIAAAVIGGTSLFGGRGSTYAALLGMLVIGSITSGMLLLQLGSAERFMITGAVLLAAVILDSLSRRGRRASGRE
ncbi:MAG TPA: sugar ABC transporter permease [Micromonosporaceae bacterium]|nr:sugar ABC transporter permease [Micromonosporaceae bacterium]